MVKTKFTKLAVCAAGGALAVATAAPAVAGAAPAERPATQQTATQQTAPQQAQTVGSSHRHLFVGRVIARSGLLVRNAPNQGGKVIGSLPFKSFVKIKCKVNGQNIDGNPRWYKLAKGKWAWASARYIVNVGKAPNFCRHHHR